MLPAGREMAAALVGEPSDPFPAPWSVYGWILWKGLIMITNNPPGQAEFACHVLDQLFADA